MVIEPPETDDLEGAVRFILLHELGHVIGAGQRVHPPWEPDGAPTPKGGYPYRLLSWKPNKKGGMDSRTRETQPLPHQSEFYTFDKAPLRMPQAQGVYAQLEETNLPSLYGASNHYDDFAEAFVIDVHTRLLGKSYRVDILKDGEVVRVYRSCLQRGDCPGKASFLRQLLGGSG